jgi:hypothetical protein
MFYVWLFMPWSLREICPKAFDEDFLPKYDSPDGRVPYNSWGNGSAMRVSAVGWFFDTLEETERVARISAEITHNHPEGIKGAQATAAAIWMARNGKSKAEIKEYIQIKYEYETDKGAMVIQTSDKFPETCRFTLSVLACEPCDPETLRHVYIVFPSFQLSPDVDLSIATDGVHAFSGSAQVDYCSVNKEMFYIAMSEDDYE